MKRAVLYCTKNRTNLMELRETRDTHGPGLAPIL